MRRDVDERVERVASGQAGAFSILQVRAAGGDARLANRRVAAGRWRMVAPHVFVLGDWPSSWRQRLWIAHLDAGARSRISHRAAAALQSAPLFVPGIVELTVPHAKHHRVLGGIVHQTRHPWPRHQLVDGLPVTRLAETYVDLANLEGMSRALLKESLAEAVRQGGTTLEAVSAQLAHVARPGRDGVILLADVLEELGLGDGIHGSFLERRFAAFLESRGEPPFRWQAAVPWRADRDAIGDGLDDDCAIYLELDGRTWHTRRHDFVRDRSRDQAASRAGYHPLRIAGEQLDTEPHDVLETIRELRRRRAGMGRFVRRPA